MLTGPLLVLLSYLCGSISSAILICRLLGKADPRSAGSGNPGTTNVLRLYGKSAAAATLAGDIAKGLVPVLIVKTLSVTPLILAASGLAAFIGHLYPVFFGFKGGKGVATMLGVLIGLNWLLFSVFAAIWLLMAALFRYSSLAALTATASLPAAAWYLNSPLEVILGISVMCVIVYLRHAGNIKNLMAGAEKKIGQRSA